MYMNGTKLYRDRFEALYCLCTDGPPTNEDLQIRKQTFSTMTPNEGKVVRFTMKITLHLVLTEDRRQIQKFIMVQKSVSCEEMNQFKRPRPS